MTRADIEADITNDAFRVIEIGRLVNDPPKQAAGINTYEADVMEVSGRNAHTSRTIVYYVYDEGLPGEDAYYKDKIRASQAELDALDTYMDTQSYQEYEILINNRDDNYSLLRVWIKTDDVADPKQGEERRIIVYRAAGSFEHFEYTPLEI